MAPRVTEQPNELPIADRPHGVSEYFRDKGYVHLANEDLEVPSGWFNERDDLEIESYFTDDTGVAAVIGNKYDQLIPILTDHEGTYVFLSRNKKTEKEDYFVWNDISGEVTRATEDDLTLRKVLQRIDRSLMALRVEKVGTT